VTLRHLADALTASRVLLAPVLAVALLSGAPVLAAVVVAWAIASDALDGPLARRAGAGRERGALFDAAADLLFLLGGYVALAWLGAVPWMVPGLMCLAFAPFAWPAVRGRPPAYDPVGRHLGTMLYAVLAVIVTLQDAALASAAALAASLVLAYALAARVQRSAARAASALRGA
jgi:phosphatidylglycerophosphate synthase